MKTFSIQRLIATLVHKRAKGQLCSCHYLWRTGTPKNLVRRQEVSAVLLRLLCTTWLFGPVLAWPAIGNRI